MNAALPASTPDRIDFLRCHEPFDSMADAAVRRFAERLVPATFALGEVVVSPGDGPVGHLYVVVRGTVGSRPDISEGEIDRLFGAGEMFPVGALSAGGSTTRTFVATSDASCLLLRREDFLELRGASPEFERFCSEAVTETLRLSLESLYAQYSQRAADERSLGTPIGELVRRAPVSCRASDPIGQAVKRMADANVRTVVAVDDAGVPVGMFTLVDLLHRVVLGGRSLDLPLSDAMSQPIHALAPGAPALEAMQLMSERGIRQVIVAEGGRLIGVVSERDLAALQRVSVHQVSARLLAAESIGHLARAAADVRRLAQTLLAQGVGAESLTRTISSLNDALTRRAIDLVRARHDVEAIAWCWLALGSEGRGEQTLSTDQDNAIVFRAGEGLTPDEARARLLPFAREVNEALAQVGFELCRGGVMASNPELCLSTQEWKAKFLGWLREPTPEALLNANIVFDFRPIFGEAALAAELGDWLSAYASGNAVFIRLMGQNALQVEPPLGLIRTFAVDDKGESRGTIDLKVRGTRLFVDCARAFALDRGCRETGTANRLRLTAASLGLDDREVGAAIDAFHFLQALRMRQQESSHAHAAANRVNPYALNELEQLMLKEAFRQARQLQETLRVACRL